MVQIMKLSYFPSNTSIELENRSLLLNSRGTSKYRIGTISNDAGNTFKDSFYFNDLLDELGGCQGSMIKHPTSKYLYYSGLKPQKELNTSVLGYNLTVYFSKNEGGNWNDIYIVDYWSSAYSALVALEFHQFKSRCDYDFI